MFSVGGAGANTTGHGYFTGGLGVGAFTTTTGQIIANVSLGVATTTPAQELSVVGDVYLTSGLGVGISTTTAGAIENIGNVLFGDASTDLVMLNSASLIFNNIGTTTIPSSSVRSWGYATSTANIPLLRFDTSNTRIGISTTTPTATLSVGGAGNVYALGGLGIGIATTSAGVIENSGNVLFGDAAADLAMFNSASMIFNNAGTTTIPSALGASWAMATSSANIPFLRYDTSNYRIGVGTSTPGSALSVAGDGRVQVAGDATSTIAIYSTGGQKGGCIEFESAEGGGTMFRLYATSAQVAMIESGSCR
jgi:hypothetical protein